MKILKILSIAVVVLLSACAIKKMKAFSNCEFKLDKVNNVTVAGVNIDPTGKRKLTLPDALAIAASLSQKKLPVSLDLNIDGKNPNNIDAKMVRFDWKIKVKDDEVLRGAVNNDITLSANSNSVFDFKSDFDLFPAVEKYSMNELKEVLDNAFDSEGNPKDLKFFMKPYLSIGKVNIPYPGYIEITKYYKSK